MTRKKHVSADMPLNVHEVITEVEVKSDGAVVSTGTHPTHERSCSSFEVAKSGHTIGEAAKGDHRDMHHENTNADVNGGRRRHSDGRTNQRTNQGVKKRSYGYMNGNSNGNTKGDGNEHTDGHMNKRTRIHTHEDTKEDVNGHTNRENNGHTNGNNNEPPNDHDKHHITLTTNKTTCLTTLIEPHEPPTHHETVKPKDLDEAAVKAYLSTRLARYKALDGGVRFIDVIPKSPSGKILKRILRIEAQAEQTTVGV